MTVWTPAKPSDIDNPTPIKSDKYPPLLILIMHSYHFFVSSLFLEYIVTPDSLLREFNSVVSKATLE